MQVILSILGGQAVNFQKYYLLARTIPLNEEGEPIMSVLDWIKQGFVTDAYQILLKGKQMEALNELRNEITIDIT